MDNWFSKKPISTPSLAYQFSPNQPTDYSFCNPILESNKFLLAF